MANINVVVLSGNLTREPEFKEFGDNGLCKLGIAVNGRKKEGDEWVDVPNFFDVTVFGKPAEWCRDQLSKGSPVVVHGRLQFRSWETDDGQKRSAVDVVADNVVLPPRQQAAITTGDEPRDDAKDLF